MDFYDFNMAHIVCSFYMVDIDKFIFTLDMDFYDFNMAHIICSFYMVVIDKFIDRLDKALEHYVLRLDNADMDSDQSYMVDDKAITLVFFLWEKSKALFYCPLPCLLVCLVLSSLALLSHLLFLCH